MGGSLFDQTSRPWCDCTVVYYRVDVTVTLWRDEGPCETSASDLTSNLFSWYFKNKNSFLMMTLVQSSSSWQRLLTILLCTYGSTWRCLLCLLSDEDNIAASSEEHNSELRAEQAEQSMCHHMCCAQGENTAAPGFSGCTSLTVMSLAAITCNYASLEALDLVHCLS
jgi:hypothetical protein